MKTIQQDLIGRFYIWHSFAARVGPFDTAQDAKHHDLQAVRVYGDNEKPFDQRIALHLALADIEFRHNQHNDIVAVGDTHYLIRRNRYGVEVPIKYKLREGIAHARNDSEAL